VTSVDNDCRFARCGTGAADCRAIVIRFAFKLQEESWFVVIFRWTDRGFKKLFIDIKLIYFGCSCGFYQDLTSITGDINQLIYITFSFAHAIINYFSITRTLAVSFNVSE
jgi:hypothetical protein